MASQLARRYCQTFSTGFNSGRSQLGPESTRAGANSGRSQLGTIGGKGQKRDVVGNGQGFAAVPTGAVEDQDGVSARRHRACDFDETGVHRCGVDEPKGRDRRLCRGSGRRPACARSGPAPDRGRPQPSLQDRQSGPRRACARGLEPCGSQDLPCRRYCIDVSVRRGNCPPDSFQIRLTGASAGPSRRSSPPYWATISSRPGAAFA